MFCQDSFVFLSISLPSVTLKVEQKNPECNNSLYMPPVKWWKFQLNINQSLEQSLRKACERRVNNTGDDGMLPHNASMADIMKKDSIKYWWGSRPDTQTFLDRIKNGENT